MNPAWSIIRGRWEISADGAVVRPTGIEVGPDPPALMALRAPDAANVKVSAEPLGWSSYTGHTLFCRGSMRDGLFSGYTVFANRDDVSLYRYDNDVQVELDGVTHKFDRLGVVSIVAAYDLVSVLVDGQMIISKSDRSYAVGAVGVAWISPYINAGKFFNFGAHTL